MSANRTALALLLALAAAGGAGGGPPPLRDEQPARRTFTNDDLDRYREERHAGRSATPAPAFPTPDPAAGTPGDEDGSGTEAHAARYEQAHGDLAEAEATRDATRARISKLEALLNPMSAEFEVDPNAILRLQAELREARAQLEEQEGVVAQARAALEAAQDEARRAGVRLPPPD